MEPPGWMIAVTPASAAAINPSAKGKKASEATTDPIARRFFSPAVMDASSAFQLSIREELTRLICPAPIPTVTPFLAYTIAFDLTCLHTVNAKDLPSPEN